MAIDRTPEARSIRWHRLFAAAGSWIAIVALLLLYVGSAYPEPSPAQYQVIRIVLALTAAGIVIALPTLVDSWPVYSRIALMFVAGTALFIAAYLLSPASLISSPPNSRPITFTICRGEYRGECGPVDYWVNCGDPSKIVNDRCSTVLSQNVIQNRDGNRCGYFVAQISCKARAAQ